MQKVKLIKADPERRPRRDKIFSGSGVFVELDDGGSLTIVAKRHGKPHEQRFSLEELIKRAMELGWQCDTLRLQDGDTREPA